MAGGAYLLSDDAGEVAVERFSCGAGPAGWRYVATRTEPRTGRALGAIDLVVDARGAVLRLAVSAGGWELRGGALGTSVLWRRGAAGKEAPERVEAASGFTGSSPAFAVALARRPGRHRLVHVGDGHLATRLVEQQWETAGTAVHEGVAVTSYDVTDLQTGQRSAVRLHGDVVLEATGVRLLDLDRVV